MSGAVIKEAPWHVAYPKTKSQPVSMPAGELLEMVNQGKISGKDFLLVDLRRVDHEGGTIRGSINLPAQSLYPSLPFLYNMMQVAQIPKIIWYCGSSKGRGNRAAAWFADYVDEQQNRGNASKIQSFALLEGIKGWERGGQEYKDLMDGYDPKAWQKA